MRVEDIQEGMVFEDRKWRPQQRYVAVTALEKHRTNSEIAVRAHSVDGIKPPRRPMHHIRFTHFGLVGEGARYTLVVALQCVRCGQECTRQYERGNGYVCEFCAGKIVAKPVSAATMKPPSVKERLALAHRRAAELVKKIAELTEEEVKERWLAWLAQHARNRLWALDLSPSWLKGVQASTNLLGADLPDGTYRLDGLDAVVAYRGGNVVLEYLDRGRLMNDLRSWGVKNKNILVSRDLTLQLERAELRVRRSHELIQFVEGLPKDEKE